MAAAGAWADVAELWCALCVGGAERVAPISTAPPAVIAAQQTIAATLVAVTAAAPLPTAAAPPVAAVPPAAAPEPAPPMPSSFARTPNGPWPGESSLNERWTPRMRVL